MSEMSETIWVCSAVALFATGHWAAALFLAGYALAREAVNR